MKQRDTCPPWRQEQEAELARTNVHVNGEVLLPLMWRYWCSNVDKEVRHRDVKEEVLVSKKRRCQQFDTNEETPVSMVSFYDAGK